METTTKIKLALLIASIVAGLGAMILALVIYFQNWNSVLTDADRWELNKFPIALWVLSAVLYYTTRLFPKSR